MSAGAEWTWRYDDQAYAERWNGYAIVTIDSDGDLNIDGECRWIHRAVIEELYRRHDARGHR